MTITPKAVLQAGAAWKLSTLSDSWYSTQNPSSLAVTSSVPEQILFKLISGWNLPTNQSVTVVPGAVTNITSAYTLAVSWPPPAAIPYGTALSSAQLNATAITPGNYVYVPANGAVLNVGTHTLSVTFTPSNTNYGGASMTSVNLVVTAAMPPVILSAKISGTSFIFTWGALTNQQYQIQSKANLTQTHWTTNSTITATNSIMTISEPIGTNSRQFFRIVLLQ